MLTVKRLLVKSWAKFVKADLRFEPGLYYVRGRNEDADGTANAAGKSSLFHALYALQYGDHQLAVKKRSLGQHTRDSTRIAASYDANGCKVVADLHDTKLKVVVADKEVAARKKDDERAELLRLIGHSPELWSATVHVNGIASNPLLRGTSSARCQFLEKAFDLDRWEPMHDKVGDILSQMRRGDAELNEAKDAKDALAALGDSIDIRAAELRITELTGKRGELRVLQDETTKAVAIRETLPERPSESVNELQERVKELRRQATTFTKDQEQRAKYSAEMSVYEEKREILQEEIHEAGRQLKSAKAGNVEALVKSIENLEQRLQSVLCDEQDGPAIAAWKKVAESVAARMQIQWKDLPHLSTLSASWVANLTGGQHDCPVCGGTLAQGVDSATLKQLKRLVSALPSNVREIRQSVPSADLQYKLEQLQSSLEATKKYELYRERLAAAKLSLSRLKPPAILPKDTRGDDPTREYDDATRRLAAANRWNEAPRSAHRNLELLLQRRDKIVALLGKIENELDQLRIDSSRAKDAETQRTKLSEKIELLESEVELRPVYKALYQAYSPNGLRLWRLQGLLESIAEGLNAGMHSTRDRYTFGYKLSRNRELSLLASNEVATFDIRTLSGAESCFFTLNFLATILPLLPESKRCNLLILDEIDANCDEHSRAIMANEYLPRLAQSVPALYIVTPTAQAEFKTRNSGELLVTKRGGVSTLSVESCS